MDKRTFLEKQADAELDAHRRKAMWIWRPARWLQHRLPRPIGRVVFYVVVIIGGLAWAAVDIGWQMLSLILKGN